MNYDLSMGDELPKKTGVGRDRRSRLVRPVLHRELHLCPPETGAIAVKVINHYGDEVQKVYGL